MVLLMVQKSQGQPLGMVQNYPANHGINYLSLNWFSRRISSIKSTFLLLCYPGSSCLIGSGQNIATSHDLTPNGGLVMEIPLFQGNLGW